MHPVIQDQLTAVFRDRILNHVIVKVKKKGCFDVISDKITDSSNKEQFNCYKLYADPEDGIVGEDLVDFIECDTGV